MLEKQTNPSIQILAHTAIHLPIIHFHLPHFKTGCCTLNFFPSPFVLGAVFPQLFLVEGKYQFQGWQYRRLFMPTLNKKTWHEAITMCLQHDALFSHNTTQVGLLSKESTGYLNYLPYMWRYGTKQAHYYPFATNGINSATRGNRHHVACLGKQGELWRNCALAVRLAGWMCVEIYFFPLSFLH